MLSFRLPARAAALGLLLGLAAGAGPASALSVTVYADGTTDYGFDPADVAAAVAAGAGSPTGVSGLDNGGGFFQITTPNGIPGVRGKNKQNPSQGSSLWTLHVDAATPADRLDDFSLVILGHDPGDPIKGYKTGNVGLELNLPQSSPVPWILVEPDNGGPTYVAFQLGDLEAGGTYDIPIEYRIGQKLKKKKGVSTFPRYAVAYVSGVPEPSVVMLGLGAVAFALALAARRKQ
jgi:hypothetical protein